LALIRLLNMHKCHRNVNVSSRGLQQYHQQGKSDVADWRRQKWVTIGPFQKVKRQIKYGLK
jgi:hypothetical protein